MRMDAKIAFAAAFIALSIASGLIAYPKMPERVAYHWNMDGEADGYASKESIFMLPALSVITVLLLLLLPRIDPLKKNIQSFRDYYNGFILSLTGFMSYLYLLMILWNAGFRFNMLQALSPAFGMLFYNMGLLVERSKRNWFIGIRTPWTLSSNTVWEKTHTLGGKMYKAAAAIALLGLAVPQYAVLLAILPIISASAYLVLYSYREYSNENGRVR